jgi:hypothetical protein
MPNARFMTGDLKEIYFNMLMDEYKYMRISISVIPESIKTEYKLAPLVHHGHVYVKIRKGMYGLRQQAGKIVNDRLTDFLLPTDTPLLFLLHPACGSITSVTSCSPLSSMILASNLPRPRMSNS